MAGRCHDTAFDSRASTARWKSAPELAPTPLGLVLVPPPSTHLFLFAITFIKTARNSFQF